MRSLLVATLLLLTIEANAEGKCHRRPIDTPRVGANVLLKDAPASPALFRRLQGLGLDTVVIPVEFRMKDLAATQVLMSPAPHLLESIRNAKKAQLFVVLVPHLHLENGAWRGELAPENPKFFFRQYRNALSKIASLAETECVEGLSVALEWKSLSLREDLDSEFRRLVAESRKKFSGILLYSANWDEVGTMRHWPLFDAIGVNAFHPLIEPDKIQSELRLLAKGKSVWFMELGFKSTVGTEKRPWEWLAEVPKSVASQDAQLKAYQEALAAIARAGVVHAVFFWAVSDHDARADPRDFSFLGKKAEQAVRQFARGELTRPAAPTPHVVVP